MKIDQLPVFAHKSNLLLDPLTNIINSSSTFDLSLKAGFAYATLGGVEHFVSKIETSKKWELIEKQFLIGIHHAITEPSALTLLNKLPNASVRVYVPNNKLNVRALSIVPLYHPKILVIEDKSNKEIKFIQSGSTNLTSSAISSNPNNYEFSLAVTSDSHKIGGSFRNWWKDLWVQSRQVDDSFILKYSKIREEILLANPILKLSTEIAPSIGQSRYLFIDVGAGSGPVGQRHQVEFPEFLAKFFGPPQKFRQNFCLKNKGRIWIERPLSYKLTTYNVDIWRLGMPTQNAGGEPISERVIRFERTSSTNTFNFEITDTGSKEHLSWVSKANKFGQLGATHGLRQRTFGFY